MTNDKNKPEFVKRNAIVSGKEYAKLLSTLKERYRRSQLKAAVSVNTTMLEYYWMMGREISQLKVSAKWGLAFFECLSLNLKTEFPSLTGLSVTNIKYTKRWYEFYNKVNIIRHQAGDELEMPIEIGQVPWKHHIEIR